MWYTLKDFHPSNNGWFFFMQIYYRGVSQKNHHLLILDGHDFMLQYKAFVQDYRSWVKHGHLTYSYFTCIAAIGCHLIQTIQNNF
jgi:hypothetical protein